jgi:hypothetical protein
MGILEMILLVLALICFLLHAGGVVARVNLQSLGLALWVFSILVGAALT